MIETSQSVQTDTQVGVAFWLNWVLVNALGFAISVAPVFIVPIVNEAMGATRGRDTVEATLSVLSPLLGVLIAISVGMLQWFVLRRYVRWANQWWLATSIGWIVGGFLASYAAFAVLGARPSTLSFNAVTAPVSAAVVGTIQWLVLRRHVRRAGWWPPASIVSGFIAESLGFYAGFDVALRAAAVAYRFGENLTAIVFSASQQAVIGAFAGSMTGIVLVWLLRHPRPNAPG